jgi:putative transposase
VHGGPSHALHWDPGRSAGQKHFTTTPDTTAPRPPDLVDRKFVASRPNELWLADITYASTWEGWLYVAFILDVYSRVIVGWQIASHLRTDLVLDALEMAIWRRDLTYGDLIHHSDAGCQYTSFRYSDRLVEAGISASIGSVGDSFDNAMAEALNGTFKAERIKLHGPWRTRQQLETAVIEWIDWYNASRLHGEIGDVPPAEHEATWYRQHTPALTTGNTNPHCTKPGGLQYRTDLGWHRKRPARFGGGAFRRDDKRESHRGRALPQ